MWFHPPGETADTRQLLDVPEAHQGVSAARGKVLPRGVEFDADAVGGMGVDGLNGLQLRVTSGGRVEAQPGKC